MSIFYRRLHKGFLLLLLPLLMFGCKQIHDSSCDAPIYNSSEPSVVRLLVHFELPKELSPFTRAEEGVVTQGSDPMPAPTEDKGSADERYIGSLRILVFTASGDLLVNKDFTEISAGSAVDWDANFAPVKGEENTYEVRFRVLPGQGYRIFAVANEPDDAHLDQVTDLNSLYHSDGSTGGANTTSLVNTIKTKEALHTAVSNHKGLPMVAELSNKAVGQPGTKENPYPVTPQLELKRVLAKVDFYLRNTDKNGDLNPNAVDAEIQSWGGDNISSSMSLFDASSVAPGLETFSQPISHNVGDKYADDNAPGKYKLVGSAFITERLSDNDGFDESSSTAVTLTTLSGGKTYIYRVPIINNRTQTDKKRFDIHRNTIYKIYADLIGNGLIQYQLLVRQWKAEAAYHTITAGDLNPLDE